MPTMVLIGAGSMEFTRNLCNDIVLTPALQESRIVLVDVNPTRLGQARDLVEAMAAEHELPRLRVEVTMDRRAALTGADYVITTFQIGGLEATRLDVEIPQRYGVGQCVGDTLGPGGIFRALRSIPLLLDICREMDEVAPDALLLNYVNPMAMLCWAVDRATGRPHIGLCHSVQGTSRMLARWIDVPYEELLYLCAGINHQAWFLTLRHGKEDLYPRLRAVVQREETRGREPVRIELMEFFGYFVTESSTHVSEYLPYFRKSERMIEEALVPRFKFEAVGGFDAGRTGGYVRYLEARQDAFGREYERSMSGEQPMRTERSIEYGSFIMEAMETGQPARVYGNVPNRGLITNLPEGSCVEVPCLVDGNGVQPIAVGELPPQLAALNRTNINVQALAVEAALTGKREYLYHAMALDPLTAAVCTLPQIVAMADEMVEAQQQWLRHFRD